MQLMIDFPGGARVDAHFADFTVHTDQPASGGGENSAPSPFDIFLSSIGTCAGIYVLGFCRQRGLATEGIRIMERPHRSPETGLVERIELEIQVPSSFPEKYLPSLVKSAELCTVKKHLENPPKIEVFTQTVETVTEKDANPR